MVFLWGLVVFFFSKCWGGGERPRRCQHATDRQDGAQNPDRHTHAHRERPTPRIIHFPTHRPTFLRSRLGKAPRRSITCLSTSLLCRPGKRTLEVYISNMVQAADHMSMGGP